MKTSVIRYFLLALFLIWFCEALRANADAPSSADAPAKKLAAVELLVGDPAPKLEVREFVRGEPFGEFQKGKTYVVEFWATWCPPCRESIPHLSELQRRHKDVVFLGVSVGDDAKLVKTFVQRHGEKMDYRVAIDARDGRKGRMERSWLDASFQQVIPVAYIVNADGRIAWIGNPRDLDGPLADVLAGRWDLAAKAAEFKRFSDERKARAQADEGDSWYVDDEKFAADFFDRLIELAKQGKCPRGRDLEVQPGDRRLPIHLATPSREPLSPDAVYRRALPSVLVIGSVGEADDEPGNWKERSSGTAWVLSEDGLMVTNSHLFENAEKDYFGVLNHRGEVFPVVAVLAKDRVDDIVLFRVAGKGFVPLPLAVDEPVGSWVGVLSHPGRQLFSFTQGHVTRYMKQLQDGQLERWMCISADFAVGSSGAPVLNRFGAVVGMATLTTGIGIDGETPGEMANEPGQAAPSDGAKDMSNNKDAKSDPRGEKPEQSGEPSAEPHHTDADAAEDDADSPPADEPEPSELQMVVKMVVPGRTIRAFCDKISRQEAAGMPALIHGKDAR